MNYELFALKDTKVGFLSPTVDSNKETAIRNFKLMINQANSNQMIGFAPEDFELYKIGDYDTVSGIISSIQPEFIVGGLSLKE